MTNHNIREGNCIIHMTKCIRKEILEFGDKVSVFLMIDADTLNDEISEQIFHMCSNPANKNIKIKMMHVKGDNIGTLDIGDATRVLTIAVGDSGVINGTKFAMAHCMETNDKVTAHMVLVPLEIGGIGETSDIVMTKTDIFFRPSYFKELSGERITRDIIIDSYMLHKALSHADIFKGAAKLVYNGIDLMFAINNRYPKGSSLPQEIYSIAPIALENTIKFPSTAIILNIPILQRLSILADSLTTEVGKSLINALTYPFMNRGVDYFDALYFIAPIMYEQYLSSKSAPKAKASLSQIIKMASGLKVIPEVDKQTSDLFDINAMISEIREYVDMYFTNTSFKISDRDLFAIMSNIVQSMIKGEIIDTRKTKTKA